MTENTPPSPFGPRQECALLAIGETLIPGWDGVPGPRGIDYLATVAAMAQHKLLPRELREMKIFLDLWDTRGMGLAHGIGPRRFSALPHAEREDALLRWGGSTVAAKRSIFQGLRSLLIAAYFVAPDATAARAAMGYPEAFGPLPDAPPRPLTPLVVPGERLSADVVIVGSGAGGGTAAAVLTAAGLDVLVLEKGGYHDDLDFGRGELEALTTLYSGPPASTLEGQLALMSGGTLGGGTVVNWTTSFATPDHVRAEWAAHGARQFAGEEYTRALEAVQQRLSVNLDHGAIAQRDAIMERGLVALGRHCAPMPRNVLGCDQGVECGRCGYGCRIGAKQSVTKTWLQDAAEVGARIVVDADVRRVRVDRGRATGVEVTLADGRRVTVDARAVVVSAGSIQTPALLRRSGLSNERIGANLRLHPATAVAGRFDEDIRPWEGGLQTRYSTEHADLDGHGYGVIYETGPMHPGAAVAFQPWHAAAHLADDMRALRRTGVVGVILRDTGAGRVTVGRDGEPVAHYRISDYDAAHLHRGVVGAAEILAAAGATAVRTAHQVRVAVDLSGTADAGRRADRIADLAGRARAQGYAPARCMMAALHIMGTAAMGGSRDTSATDPDGATWEVPNLVVADASCFPTPSGVNPMISIEAIAHMNASRLAARLG